MTPSDLPSSLQDLPFEPAHDFLGLEPAQSAFETAAAVVLPVPWESTTSYGGGTRNGPQALLQASRYLELYDQELDAEVGTELGVHTLPQIDLTRSSGADAMAELRRVHDQVLRACGDRFLVMLGGEHAISSPAILSHAAARSERISVLQFDAHADLRPLYQGSPQSHASAMARVIDEVDLVGVGLRAVSAEEVEVARSRDSIHLIWADRMWRDDRWMDEAIERLGPQVYITFDIDYFDPSIMPSTGTPEPGGGDWYRTLAFLRRVFREREVIGCDVVELAPTPGLHAPDFVAAKLVYKMLGYRFQDRFGDGLGSGDGAAAGAGPGNGARAGG